MWRLDVFDSHGGSAYDSRMTTAGLHPAVERLLGRAQTDPDILAVLLFGSRARGDAGPGSDFDVCLVLTSDAASNRHATEKQLEYLAITDLDLAVFQALPLYVHSRVLREGTVLFVRDEDALYARAARTARSFAYFQPAYREYLEQVARG
jgi:predicted nucleotidyltransferase